MKKLAIVFAVGAAALLGGSAANDTVKAKAATDQTQQSTHRHWRQAYTVRPPVLRQLWLRS